MLQSRIPDRFAKTPPYMGKPDINMVRRLCRANLTLEQGYEFCEYIHTLKDRGNRGSGKRGDFTYKELKDILEEFKEAYDAN